MRRLAEALREPRIRTVSGCGPWRNGRPTSPSAANQQVCGFELSGLRLDTLGAPLTNSWFPFGDGEKRPPVNVAGAQTRAFKPDRGANGETLKSLNVGQLRTSG